MFKVIYYSNKNLTKIIYMYINLKKLYEIIYTYF